MNDFKLYDRSKQLLLSRPESSYKVFAHGQVAVSHKSCHEVISPAGEYICQWIGNMLNRLSRAPTLHRRGSDSAPQRK